MSSVAEVTKILRASETSSQSIRAEIKRSSEIQFFKYNADNINNHISEVIKALEENTACTSIEISADNKREQDIRQPLLESILNRKNLLDLTIASFTLSQEQMKKLAALPLRSLTLSHCDIREDHPATTLAQSLTLKKLTIFRANISDVSAKALSENRFLDQLYFVGSKISIEGLLALLVSNRLSALTIEDPLDYPEEAATSCINTADAPRIEKALAANTRLEFLTLCFELTAQMEDSLRRNRANNPFRKVEVEEEQLNYAKFLEKLAERNRKLTTEERTLCGFNPNGMKPRSPLINMLIAYELFEAVFALIENFSDTLDPNQRDLEGKTALITAAKINGKTHSAEKVALVLLKYCADRVDINAQDSDGRTALHYSIISGKVNLTQELQRRNANFMLTDNRGRTPLACLLMDEKETRETLNTIFINPDRDANACYNTLRLYNIPRELLLSTKRNLQLVLEHVQSSAFIPKESAEYRNAMREKYIRICREFDRFFTGKSVIETITSSRGDIRKIFEPSQLEAYQVRIRVAESENRVLGFQYYRAMQEATVEPWCPSAEGTRVQITRTDVTGLSQTILSSTLTLTHRN